MAQRVDDRSSGALEARAKRGSSTATPPHDELATRFEMHCRLARLLDPKELQRAILRELRELAPNATAAVSFDPLARVPELVLSKSGERRGTFSRRPPKLIAVPLIDEGEALGWIAYLHGGRSRIDEADAISNLLSVAHAAAIPTRNAKRYEHTLELIQTDALTGIYNRRGFDIVLAREAEAARRHRRALSVILGDVDAFKSINDRWGHLAGDAALRTVAQLLVSSVRRSDPVARVGGDEFAVVLPGATAGAASKLEARLAADISTSSVVLTPEGVEATVAMSFGSADLEEGGGDETRMIALADQRLYDAKRTQAAPCVTAAPAQAEGEVG